MKASLSNITPEPSLLAPARGGRSAKTGVSPIIQRRILPTDSLDYFPTPPWATRAFLATLGERGWISPEQSAWEPACGEGHMAEPLREAFGRVHASDVHDYGCGYEVGSFLGGDGGLDLDLARAPFEPDWIVTNPPFTLALPFLKRALEEARVGVAFLLRLAWVESQERYNDIFSVRPPTLIAQCVDRVPMLSGRYDPASSTTMAYAWFVWLRAADEAPKQFGKHSGTQFTWIPPGAPARFTRPVDLTPRFVRSVQTYPDLFEVLATE